MSVMALWVSRLKLFGVKRLTSSILAAFLYLSGSLKRMALSTGEEHNKRIKGNKIAE